MERVRPLRYHERIRDYLKSEEADLWEWFSSGKFLAEYADNIRLDILKSAYRLEREAHGALYARADEVLRRLGLAVPPTLYQSQLTPNLNAGLSYLPGEAHLVFSGPILTTLSPGELDWVMGHEFAHFGLLDGWNGDFLVADQILAAMAAHRRAEPSQIESCRLFRLTTEIFADRGALAAAPDPMTAVSALVKIETGLKEVDPAAYLRQADEILARDKARTGELTHPEAYLRARAIKLWTDRGEAADPEIARMIEGPPLLDELDLVAQVDLRESTRRIISGYLQNETLRSEALLAHARLFFGNFADPASPMPPPASLQSSDASIQQYACYVLLDFATADPQLADAPLSASIALSRKLGIEDRFLSIAGRELKLKKKQIEKLREAVR